MTKTVPSARRDSRAPGRPDDLRWMRLALRLARRAYGYTSPNPMVGAVLVRSGRRLGAGWHRRAGAPHAEIEALRDAVRRGHSPAGATLYVTLEPCSTHGRTPPCTDALIRSAIKRVVVAATDPNPAHAGRGYHRLRAAGIEVETGLLAEEATRLNEAFNHWIVRRMPLVTVKAAMTLDGRIATARGESKWITGAAARAEAMRLRHGADAVLVGINTILADDSSLTIRPDSPDAQLGSPPVKPLRRLVLDSRARTPLSARVVSDQWAPWTTIFVGEHAPRRRLEALATRIRVVVAPSRIWRRGRTRVPRGLDLRWILRHLGREGVTNLLVEGGGEVNASFLERRLAQRIAFFYAPKILGDRRARSAVAGEGAAGWPGILRVRDIAWRRLGADLYLSARVEPRG